MQRLEVLDVLPTMTDALQVPTPAAIQGESLVGLAQGIGAGYPRPAIASQYELAHTMRLGRWKLWVGGTGDSKLTDAVNDPGEAHELSAERPLQRRFVGDALTHEAPEIPGVRAAVAGRVVCRIPVLCGVGLQWRRVRHPFSMSKS